MTPTLDFSKRELRWDGGSVYLRKGEQCLLVGLVRPRLRALSYNQLVEVAYPDPDDEPDDAKGTIDVTLHRLKQKIAPAGLRLLTHHGFGHHLSHDLSIDWRHA